MLIVAARQWAAPTVTSRGWWRTPQPGPLVGREGHPGLIAGGLAAHHRRRQGPSPCGPTPCAPPSRPTSPGPPAVLRLRHRRRRRRPRSTRSRRSPTSARPTAWLHVGAAMSSSAAVVMKLRFVNDGLDRVDSYRFGPASSSSPTSTATAASTWRTAPISSGRCRCCRSTCATPPPEAGRWSTTGTGTCHSAGASGRSSCGSSSATTAPRALRHHVRRHVELTRELVGWIEADDRFELAARVPLNLVCFRHVGGDDANQAILDGCTPRGAAPHPPPRRPPHPAAVRGPDPHRAAPRRRGLGFHITALA